MRKLLSLFPLIAALVAVSAVATAQTGYESATEVEGATTVDAATAKQLFDRGVIFVDVRDAGLGPFAVVSVLPEADVDRRAGEELAGEGDRPVYELVLDESAADVAFA